MSNKSNKRQENPRRAPVPPSQRRPVKRLNDVHRTVEQRVPVQKIAQNGRISANRRNVNPKPPSAGAAPKQSSRLTKVVTVWVAVLTVLLIMILIISFTGRNDGAVPAGGTAGNVTDTETVTTEIPITYPVNYAEFTDDTVSFSSSLAFDAGILIDIENGTVLASRRGDERIYPASMTKIMTLIVAAEAVDDLDETFTMTAEITDPLYLANASVAGFSVGEKVTVRDLIYGLILPSGGDGALGLAYHIAGSEEAFAELMNEKARELGLTETHFTNCTGLHGADHYSTCHEIALMLEYAIQDDFMREVLSTYRYTTESTPEHPEGIELVSTLLSRMNGDEPETVFVQGGKTGYTTEAKNCLASFATDLTPGFDEDQLKEKKTKYILVTAGSVEKFGPVFDAISIYKTLSDDSSASAVDTGTAAVTAAVTAASLPEETDVTVKNTEKTEKTSKKETSEREVTAETSAESSAIKIYTAAVPE